MNWREYLRERLGVKKESGDPNAPEVNDEEILNVLRREKQRDDGEEELTTNEIAEQLPIGSKQTHNRLKELKKNDRVEKRRAGRTDMWSLALGEPETEMNPDLGRVIEQSSRARRKAPSIKEYGFNLSGGGFVLLIIGMTLLMSEISLFPGSTVWFLALGYSLGVVGAFFIMVAIVMNFAGVVTPSIVHRLLLD